MTKITKKTPSFWMGLALSVCIPALSACTAAQEVSNKGDEVALKTPAEIAEKGVLAAKSFPGLVGLCDLTMKFRNVNVPRTAEEGARKPSTAKRNSSSRSEQKAPLGPMQVFDNLYFVGNSSVSAWLVGTENDGYVLFDALTSNEAAETYVMGGIEKLGLDPRKIKHFIISHGHGDHYGGHRYLSEKLGLPVSMSAKDWELSSRLGVHPRFGPAPSKENGAVVEDGQQIVLGETVINLYVAPAHTPGTISPTISVYDNGVPHTAVLWGGTGMNFGPDPRQLRVYAKSAARLRDLSTEQGVDIFLSNHPARDASDVRMRALAKRQAGEPHPFVMGSSALGVFDVFENCALAQAERIESGAYDEN